MLLPLVPVPLVHCSGQEVVLPVARDLVVHEEPIVLLPVRVVVNSPAVLLVVIHLPLVGVTVVVSDEEFVGLVGDWFFFDLEMGLVIIGCLILLLIDLLQLRLWLWVGGFWGWGELVVPEEMLELVRGQRQFLEKLCGILLELLIPCLLPSPADLHVQHPLPLRSHQPLQILIHVLARIHSNQLLTLPQPFSIISH